MEDSTASESQDRAEQLIEKLYRHITAPLLKGPRAVLM